MYTLQRMKELHINAVQIVTNLHYYLIFKINSLHITILPQLIALKL